MILLVEPDDMGLNGGASQSFELGKGGCTAEELLFPIMFGIQGVDFFHNSFSFISQFSLTVRMYIALSFQGSAGRDW